MADPQSTFNDKLTSTREEILRRLRGEDLEEVKATIASALADIEASEGELTPERAQRLKARYNGVLQQLQDELTSTAEAKKQRAQEDTSSAWEEALIAAAVAAGLSSSDVPDRDEWAPAIGRRVRIHINVRRGLDDSYGTEQMFKRTLQSVGEDISGAIDEAQGQKTVAETVKNITSAVASGDLSEAFREAGMEVQEDSDLSLSSVSQLYANVKRIVSHEAASVADETSKTLAALNPAVDLVRWSLSPRHHSLRSSPDACDILAQSDLYNYGEGLYHPSVVPSIPHPHCECRTKVVLKDPSDWFGEDRPVPDEPSIEEGSVRELMETVEGERTVTDAHVQKQAEMIASVVSAVHENPRGLPL